MKARTKPVGSDGLGSFGLSVVVAALLSALTSFLVLGGLTPIEPSRDALIIAMAVNAVLISTLIYLVAKQAYRLYRARRAEVAGTRLHVRFVIIFSAIATVPVIVVALIASVSLSRGLDPWFSGWINTLMHSTVEIAHAYRELQCRTLARETTLMAADLDRARILYDADRAVFREFMHSRSVFLGFPVAMLVEPNGDIVERIENMPLENFTTPTAEDLAQADARDALCLVPAQGELLHAILSLPAHDGRVLVVTRLVDRRALDFPEEAEAGIAYYRVLEQVSAGMQIALGAMFAIVAVIIFLSAVWFGFSYANALVGPIRRLINATQQVATGNFYVQVPIRKAEGDLASLSETFNQMTGELRRQHDGLTAASDLIDRRRRFTEAVLSGVSAGVIGIDSRGRVTIANPTAARAFGLEENDIVDAEASEALPELAPLIAEAFEARQKAMQNQIIVTRRGRERILNVRLTREQARGEDKGIVITLDDITDLVTAQRTSAWADVARRIAHEIKNPLTPIQLSAERIRRKYGKVITTDREVFDQCTDTIVRQVDDIKRMVDEFSSFARMPKPRISSEDLADTVRQIVFMMRIGYPDIAIEDDAPREPVTALFDRRLIAQALTNIIKNAAEAIAASPDAVREGGRIQVRLRVEEGGLVVIEIDDNGKGFPVENRARLLEPYMTSRDGGTGLGLAIVGKIVEEHGGGIDLLDNPAGRGARVRLWFPTSQTKAEGNAAARSDGRADAGVT
ncbi:MAG: PAS domain-containing sensor histidine kinase [Salinarimonadaceae bacterium]|nr:MAG: PAS domain-containing sensor histidine kinase [Salinarimonadaceae bacterium]